MMNWLGLLVSYIYVFAFMGISAVLMRTKVVGPATTRKVIHIGVAHWWLIATATMDSPLFASVGPLSFIWINALILRLRLLPAMDAAAGRGNLGTVWFPVSLLVLVNLCWRGLMPAWVGGIGILTMGWGDGLASLAGEKWGGGEIRLWRGRKSVLGTAVMFGASFAVALVFSLLFNRRLAGIPPVLGAAAATAAVAAAVELVTPFGVDNLTVPLGSAAFYWGVFT